MGDRAIRTVGDFTQNALTRRGIANRFPQVIGFINSVHIFDDETSAFEHAAEFEIGFGARHRMDYPLHAGRACRASRIASPMKQVK